MKEQSGKPKVEGWYWVNFDKAPVFWDGEGWEGIEYMEESDRWIGPLKRPEFRGEKE